MPDEWEFSPGDIIAEEHPMTMSQGGVDVHTTESDSEEIIKRRLTDVDGDGKRFYHIEEETPHGKIKRHLKSASMVENIYEKVGVRDEQ